MKLIWSQHKRQFFLKQIKHTFSHADVHIGDIPAESTAMVVGHDQTILFERPSEVTLDDPTIQTDFRASGDRLLGQDQKTKKDLISSGVVLTLYYNLQHT